MKRVAYLFGAGVTQAETDFAGAGLRLLTFQITEGIESRLDQVDSQIRDLISNDLFTAGVDIEQLISLFESTGTARDTKAASFLRNSFMAGISRELGKMDADGGRFQPVLMSALFEMHSKYDHDLDEEMAGILTLNYDDFAERALQEVYDGFSFGFKMVRSQGYNLAKGPILLKLHGSFNWINDFPPSITSIQETESDNCLWIPPGVEKKREKYPFNILWGKAKEVLDCDILRVIGCSLSRNDWQLISLLHSAKRARGSSGFSIEDIDYIHVDKEDKCTQYPYLDITPILSIDGFRKYFIEQTGDEELINSNHPSRVNCFHEWIKFRGAILEKLLTGKGKDLSESQFIMQI
jgi:hypothetical protein